ncbi:MAG TPA: lipoyl domain-containing protein [Planctomycetaceae bacterium]|jgi:2-oxoglutarate dehydrogenase E2 component (dihydrolipoamide succinyltransferase)
MTNSPDIPQSLVPILLPDLGTAGATLHITAWYVEPGDSVEMGEPILEVMIPGVTCDIPAPAPGTITRLDRPLDATVSPGDVVAWLAPRN